MTNLRRVVQVIAFAVFTGLFLLTIGKYDFAAQGTVLKSRAPIDLFFKIDPLVGITTMVAARKVIHALLIYALPIVLLSIFAGRFFCGWLCPLGTALDVTDAVFFRKRKPGCTGVRQVWRTKYYVLLGVLVAAAFGSQLAFLLDPITIITRAFTLALFPIVQLTSQSLGGLDFVSEHLPFISHNSYIPSDVQYFYRLNFFAAVIFIAILAANSLSRRFWCRNLCPLGALLGLLSRFSLIKRVVKSDCAHCGKCVPDCKMGAIMENPTDYRAPECVYCYSCTGVCPKQSTTIVPTIRTEGYHGELDLNRRRTLQAFGIGALAAVLGKTNADAKTDRTGRVKVSSAQLIRPPGALPEDEFVDRCVRCSECMKICPTNGLQPALTEAGLEGLWSPVLVPRMGECTQQCNLCSKVCPSQAIQPFDISEKAHIYIGRAVIDRSQCIAWNSNRQCLVCDEHCSYHALHWKEVDGVRRPFVEEHKCVGCGICENACPIQPHAAIKVYSLGDRRGETRKQQKAFFEQAPRSGGSPHPGGDPYTTSE
ncbi:MAG: 4Fe-4S binding protein [Armatimonadota bacterium]|nr:4Fe-4S binding protein [bacterium]